MRKQYYLLFLFLLTFKIVYSQNDSLIYNHSVVVNINDLFIKRILITYSRPIDSRFSLELSIGYRYSNKRNVDAGSFLYFKDAFWYYNSLTLRVGIKRYFNKEMFTSFSTNFNYQFFNRLRFNRYQDYEGDLADVDCLISRKKYQFGGLVKVGFVVVGKKKRFIMENYIGLGLLYSLDRETISERFYSYGQSDLNPIKSSNNHFIPTIHLGISIGILK